MAARSEPYLTFSQEKRDEVARLARQGFSVREICRRVGTHHHNVRPIVRALDAAGELPAHCPCGAPRGPGHKSATCSVSTAPPRRYPKVRQSRVPKATLDEVYRRLKDGQSKRRIVREVGVAATTVTFHERRWRARRDKDLPPCKCGRPARHPGGCIVNSPSLLSRERVGQIEAWARAGLSAAEMLRRSRKSASLGSILKYATPVWERMAEDGTFCGCGERRGHVGLCAATWESRERIRGPQLIPATETRRIVNALLNGDSILTIRRAVPTSERRVYRVHQAMTPAERHRRACIVWRRVREDDEQHGRDLYQQVQAAVPRHFEDSIRDEVVAELCLAVLQGDLTLEQIRQHAKRFVGRAFTAWANVRGPRSLDETLGHDGDRTLADTIGDLSSVEQMDEAMLGVEW